MTEASIADCVRKCLEEFSLLKNVESPLATESDRKAVLEIVEEDARFKIWSGNIGAHSTGRRSLQYRLRDASHLQKQVVSLLHELSELLVDAYAIAIGEKIPWDHVENDEGIGFDSKSESDDDFVPATEMSQIAQNVSDVIDCLLRLSVAIRNPAPHDRFATFLSIDASHYEKYDIDHVRSKFSKIEPFLAERLGRSISRRRLYFKYRESHHLKLSQGLNCREANDGSTIASSLPQRAKAPGFNVEAVDEDEASDSGVTQTSFVSSNTGADKLRVPPLPREAENGPFECPFCYVMIIATSSLSWKRHVFADLRPYVCLSKDCTASEMEFMRRREWMLHEVQNHWRTYPCPCACGEVFPVKALCQEHVSKIHSDAFSKDQVSSVIDLSSKSIKVEDGIHCPLCKEPLHSMKQYQRHAGRHQEQLALFALPSIGTGDDDAQLEDDVSGTHSNVFSDAQREQSAMEDEHDSFAKSLEDDIDKNVAIMLEGAKAMFSNKPSAVSQEDSEKEWEAPAGAKWTKISRRVVSLEALEIGKENFEINGDFVIVLRVLSPEEIERYASATRVLRERRRREEDTISNTIYEAEMQSKGPGREHQPSPTPVELSRMSENETEAGNDMKPGEVELSEEQGDLPFSLERSKDLDQDETASYTSDRSQSKRHSVRPTSGDAVLVAYLNNGRDPEIARAAGRESLPYDKESLDEDVPDRSVNWDLISGPLLRHLAENALQAASLATAPASLKATVPKTIPDISIPTGESDYSQNSSVVEGNDDVQAQFKAPEGPRVDEIIRRFDEEFHGRR